MARQKILVIEDDEGIRQGIVDALSFEGYTTLEAARGDVGLQLALGARPDLVLLDLALPGKDGLEVLEELRRAHAPVSVIVLTARGEESDRVRGLRLGADDYVVKPFSVKELLARVEAVLRRSPELRDEPPSLSLPDGAEVDFAASELRFAGGDRVELSRRESELLAYLAAHAGRAVSRDELLARVWHIPGRRVETRTVDMHVARLREKLRDSGGRVLRTVRGKGYLLAAECGSSRPAREGAGEAP